MSSQDDVRPLVQVTGDDESYLTSATWERLEDQVEWYDRKSLVAQRAYKRARVTELVVATAIPVAASASAPAFLLALLGGVIVVLEGVQHLYQWQQNWTLYRSTAEALKHERYLFLAHAGPYEGPQRVRALAERVEGLVSQEHAKWAEARDKKDGNDTDDG